MGSPQSPTEQQYAELEHRGMLETVANPHDVRIEQGKTAVKFDLPRAAVSLVVLKFSP
jgi:xylan 1,4-beta-xylosidase